MEYLGTMHSYLSSVSVQAYGIIYCVGILIVQVIRDQITTRFAPIGLQHLDTQRTDQRTVDDGSKNYYDIDVQYKKIRTPGFYYIDKIFNIIFLCCFVVLYFLTESVCVESVLTVVCIAFVLYCLINNWPFFIPNVISIYVNVYLLLFINIGVVCFILRYMWNNIVNNLFTNATEWNVLESVGKLLCF